MTNLLERIKKVDQANESFERLSKLVEQDQTEENINQQNKAIEELENALMFVDQQEKEHWLDVLATYKFWEDFEELTLRIIHKEEDRLETICTDLWECARALAQLVDFETLYNAFTTVEKDWLGTMDTFKSWWNKQTDQDKLDYAQDYEETYGERFNIKDIKKIAKRYYAFEKCSICMFYENSKSGSADLIECIFERYLQGGFRQDMSLLIKLINELLNADLFKLLRTYKKAIIEFNEDIENDNSTKGSLDNLQDVQADIYEWVEKEID